MRMILKLPRIRRKVHCATSLPPARETCLTPSVSSTRPGEKFGARGGDGEDSEKVKPLLSSERFSDVIYRRPRSTDAPAHRYCANSRAQSKPIWWAPSAEKLRHPIGQFRVQVRTANSTLASEQGLTSHRKRWQITTASEASHPGRYHLGTPGWLRRNRQKANT